MHFSGPNRNPTLNGTRKVHSGLLSQEPIRKGKRAKSINNHVQLVAMEIKCLRASCVPGHSGQRLRVWLLSKSQEAIQINYIASTIKGEKRFLTINFKLASNGSSYASVTIVLSVREGIASESPVHSAIHRRWQPAWLFGKLEIDHSKFESLFLSENVFGTFTSQSKVETLKCSDKCLQRELLLFVLNLDGRDSQWPSG